MLRLDFNLVLTMINLLVLCFLLRKFLIRPLNDIMEKRKAMIEEGIRHADELRTEALNLKKQYEQVLNGAKKESAEIIEQAKKEAKAEYNLIIDDADKHADQVIHSARESAETEREQTLLELKSKAASLAIDAARKILTEQSNEKENQAFYDQFLEEAGDMHDRKDNG